METFVDVRCYFNDAMLQAALNANAFRPELSRDGKAFFWIWGIMKYSCLTDLSKHSKFSSLTRRLTDECYEKLEKTASENPQFESEIDNKSVDVYSKIKIWQNKVKSHLRSDNTVSLMDFIFQKFIENDFSSNNYIKEIKMRAVSELKIDPDYFDVAWSRIKRIFRNNGLK